MTNISRRAAALVLSAAVAMSGCASAGRSRVSNTPAAAVIDPTIVADYVQRLPAGSHVRVERTSGDTIKGVLMKATPGTLVVQKDTRVPEEPVEIPVAQVTRITVQDRSGHSVALGIWAGIGIAFGSLFILGALLAAGE